MVDSGERFGKQLGKLSSHFKNVSLMKLTDKAIKAIKPGEKIYRIFDGEGLYLEIHPSGSKYWRMKLRTNGKEDRLAFGVYPKVSLAEARQKRADAKEILDAGKNPRYVTATKGDMTFREVSEAWLGVNRGAWTERYYSTVLRRLEKDVLPRLGNLAAKRIDASDILEVVRKIDNRGAPEKAKRVLRYINGIISFAIITIGEMKYNPAMGLHVAISAKPVKHNPYLKESELPEFLKRLDAYEGFVVRRATRFLLLTMTRTSEVRFARPEEIDWREGVWKIPPERMKMRRPHWVPLSAQAIAILEEMKEWGGGYIFPSAIRDKRPISENTILYAIYDLGYRGKLTGHGLRATASTILNERGFNSMAIERQLAHVDSNKVRAAYNHAELLSERREILQAWADLLDHLQTL